MVPPEADLVLLEFTFNDAERASTAQSADDPTRCACPQATGLDCVVPLGVLAGRQQMAYVEDRCTTQVPDRLLSRRQGVLHVWRFGAAVAVVVHHVPHSA